MNREVMYKCTFCRKYEESREQKFLALGSEQVGGEVTSNEFDLCDKCYKVFRKLVKAFGDKELHELLCEIKYSELSELLKSSSPVEAPSN
tara:strand:+ start:458 stop:727 length:270 start_codon:yes stop_codon:yes gene_type:complete